MKKLVFLLILTLLFTACTVPCLAAYHVTVFDEIGIMGGADAMEASGGYDVQSTAFYLWTKSATSQNDYPTNSTVRSKFGIFDNASAVVLVVRLVGTRTYYYDMYTYGAANDVLTDADVDRILDDTSVYNNMKSGNITSGAASFFSLCASTLHERYAAEQERAARAPLMALIFGLVAGAVVAGCSVLGVVLHYRKKLHGTVYPLDRYARLNLTRSEDRFVGRSVTRVRVQSNNGGSRSRGGGGGGGGGRRGGR